MAYQLAKNQYYYKILILVAYSYTSAVFKYIKPHFFDKKYERGEGNKTREKNLKGQEGTVTI